jgi:hypothetical protein
MHKAQGLKGTCVRPMQVGGCSYAAWRCTSNQLASKSATSLLTPLSLAYIRDTAVGPTVVVQRRQQRRGLLRQRCYSGDNIHQVVIAQRVGKLGDAGDRNVEGGWRGEGRREGARMQRCSVQRWWGRRLHKQTPQEAELERKQATYVTRMALTISSMGMCSASSKSNGLEAWPVAVPLQLQWERQ